MIATREVPNVVLFAETRQLPCVFVCWPVAHLWWVVSETCVVSTGLLKLPGCPFKGASSPFLRYLDQCLALYNLQYQPNRREKLTLHAIWASRPDPTPNSKKVSCVLLGVKLPAAG